jgi:2-keto-3-deoxy-L-rhamnonate aldolase RhmA
MPRHWIIPLIVDAIAEARAAVAMSKYPPIGRRSIESPLSKALGGSSATRRVQKIASATGSTVIIMIETKSGLENVNEIAQVDGVDGLLVGVNDLALDLETSCDSESFRTAVLRINRACIEQNKLLAIGGVYDKPEFRRWAMCTLQVWFLLVGQDSAFIGAGARQALNTI